MRIVPRLRGSPLDKLVAELMIKVNATWGELLAKAGAAGLYRVQSGGKVKMSTRPGEHQGLGLTHYLWSSSPLRRYADLVNQRQLLAVVAGARPDYAANDGEVVMVRDCFASGNTVLVHHGGRLFTAYFHMSKFEVKEGQKVKRGELLGLVGKTGRVTGPHLHFGVKLDGRWVNAESLLRLSMKPSP